MSNPTMVTANLAMLITGPHAELESAVRYADALEAYNNESVQFMRDLRSEAPELKFAELEEFANALRDYREAHTTRNAGVAQARSKVLEIAERQQIPVDADSTFYKMLYRFSFRCGLLARLEAEALAERNPLSA